MKRMRFILTASTLLILACSFIGKTLNPSPTPTDTQAPPHSDSGCPDVQPAQTDIDAARQYRDEYFPAPEWKTSYAVAEYRVSVTRKNDGLGAVSNFETIIYCGVTNAALDNYYTDKTFDIIFQYYAGHTLLTECRSTAARLYEFKVKNQGSDYNARFWVEILDQDHIRESLLVFPIADVSNLDSYSQKLMPKLPSCE